MTGICTSCGEEGQISVDHLIPQWFTRKLWNFGFSHESVMDTAGISYNTKSYPRICVACNQSKSGKIDFRNPIVRRYMRTFIDLIEIELNKPMLPKRFIVICKCQECEQIKKFEERVKIFNEIKQIHNPQTVLSPRETYLENNL